MLHLVANNCAAHKHPRFNTRFAPASASWLTMVEGFFRDIPQKVIRANFLEC